MIKDKCGHTVDKPAPDQPPESMMAKREKMPTHEKGKIISMALDSGFMLSTMYGQDTNKLMPASDTDTLLKFAEAVTKAKVEAIRGLMIPEFTHTELPIEAKIKNTTIQSAIDILEGR